MCRDLHLLAFCWGLIPAAWVIGCPARSTRSFWRIALAALAGLAVLYAVGRCTWR
ncbi:MAG: hypothetical protein ACLU38_15185 [Dysosmobacter sp.]